VDSLRRFGHGVRSLAEREEGVHAELAGNAKLCWNEKTIMELEVFRASSSYFVVTELALIDVERKATQKGSRAAGMLLGAAVGGAVGAAVGAGLFAEDDAPTGNLLNLRESKPVPPLAEIDDVLTCDASDVPEELRSHPGWPVVDDERPVTFYPRSVVQIVLVGFTGDVRIRPRYGESKRLGIDFWKVPRAKRALARAGYVVR
jgi:hypothetical protein